MPRVLLLATTTGYQTRAFEDAAANLGVELVYATDRCHVLSDPWRDGAIPIRFHEEDLSVAQIMDVARTRPIDGIVTVGDRPTVIAARVAEVLGLAGHSSEAASIARNKQRLRERLGRRGLLSPQFAVFPHTRHPHVIAEQIAYPCVLKPTSLSGSRGVMRADDPDAFMTMWDRLAALLQAPDVRSERSAAHEAILVEDFIPGREFALEGVMTGGELQPLALFEKPDPLDGPFFEETIYVTPSRAARSEQQAIVREVSRAAEVIGLMHGPVHAECRVNANGVYVLEVAARPIGGLCARALAFTRGSEVVGLEELLLRHALGEPTSRWTRERRASGVMMIPIPGAGLFRGVRGVEDARRVAGIEDVRITVKPDQRLVPLPEGSSYLGFIFSRAATTDEAERALRAAHDRLEFAVQPEIAVLQSRHG